MSAHPVDVEPRVAVPEPLADPTGEPVEVRVDPTLKIATEAEQTVGVFGPTNWWRLGIIAIVVLAAVLLLMQVMTSSPTTPPVGDTPQAGQPAVSTD